MGGARGTCRETLGSAVKENTVTRWIGMILALSVVGCATGPQISVKRELKAATSRSTGCPSEKLSISQYRPRARSWKAIGCKRTYSCVSIDLEAELADCSSKVAKLPF
jgi:hypothetical protein